MAVSFANIFMAAVETEIINHSHFKPLTWKRYIDDAFSLWNINKEEINSFIELAKSYHLTIKFTAEISDREITFLDTCVHIPLTNRVRGPYRKLRTEYFSPSTYGPSAKNACHKS